jgi:hypothetical protein
LEEDKKSRIQNLKSSDFISFQSKIANQKSIMANQRINACRKRLRRTRSMQRALRIEQDEAVLAANNLLASMAGNADLSDAEDVFEEARASKSGATRQFTPEVDRRARLRAR